jgi:uncharacterized protein YbcC (UPF0753/DUF2309 family)
MSDALGSALEHALHLLPHQGPIDIFIHQNTLSAFQGLPFHDAVRQAASLFSAEPYLPEAEYRAAFSSGRIEREDLDAALTLYAPEIDVPTQGALIGRDTLLRAAMLHTIDVVSDDALAFMIEDEALFDSFREDIPELSRKRIGRTNLAALWDQAVRLGSGRNTRSFRKALTPRGPRTRDAVLAETGKDTDLQVHPVLIRLSGAYLDPGASLWPIEREPSFYSTVHHALINAPSLPAWMARAAEIFRAHAANGNGAEGAAKAELRAIATDEHDWENVVLRTLLALSGWAGMFARLEAQPRRDYPSSIAPTLLDFLAVRLVLDRAAAEKARATHQSESAGDALSTTNTHETAHLGDGPFRLFQLFQVCGVSLSALASATPEDGATLLCALDSFEDSTRRMIWHEAFERKYRRTILSAVSQNRAKEAARRVAMPTAQLVVCMDDREESFRRHVEELAPDVETFGTAGFFGMSMELHSPEHAHPRALCPANQSPQMKIVEAPYEHDEPVHTRRASRKQAAATIAFQGHTGTRSALLGAALSLVVGILALLPLSLRILMPRAFSRWLASLEALGAPPPRTNLIVENTAGELAVRLARTLREFGLPGRFSRFVVVLGHGSTSRNNPHASAYDCGACGGNRGGSNARLFAQVANRSDVREALRGLGIDIPSDTHFVGGLHDTTRDHVTLFDLDRVPASHAALLERIEGILANARRRNAHERCRRFMSAPTDITEDAALMHVEARAESIAEPRAECGHATNAVAIVGRRALTRGLYLDRRAFLISYDPLTDGDGAILEGILNAALPVGSGITLEYFFSRVDNERYGCGTKLPHNMAAHLGVMAGGAGDLLTGLPWQMVEIHEPLRLLCIVETRGEVIARIASRSPLVAELVNHGWVHLVLVDPETGAMTMAENGTFVPVDRGGPSEISETRIARVSSSKAAYQGQRDHVWPVRIESRGAEEAEEAEEKEALG